MRALSLAPAQTSALSPQPNVARRNEKFPTRGFSQTRPALMENVAAMKINDSIHFIIMRVQSKQAREKKTRNN
jgi:hypothetical protein